MADVAEKRMTMNGEMSKKSMQKAPLIAKGEDKKTKKKTEASLMGTKKSTLKNHLTNEKNAGKGNTY
jgi:hypothetical protein